MVMHIDSCTKATMHAMTKTVHRPTWLHTADAPQGYIHTVLPATGVINRAHCVVPVVACVYTNACPLKGVCEECMRVLTVTHKSSVSPPDSQNRFPTSPRRLGEVGEGKREREGGKGRTTQHLGVHLGVGGRGSATEFFPPRLSMWQRTW